MSEETNNVEKDCIDIEEAHSHNMTIAHAKVSDAIAIFLDDEKNGVYSFSSRDAYINLLRAQMSIEMEMEKIDTSQ